MQRLSTVEHDKMVNVAATAVVIATYALLAAVVHIVMMPMFRTVCARITFDRCIVSVDTRVVSTNQTTV